MTLLRAMSPKYSSDEAILQAFYETEDGRHRRPQGRRQARRPDRLRRRHRPEDRRGPDRERLDHLQDLGAGPGRRRSLGADRRSSKEAKDPLILQSLQEDPTTDHESALLRIYQRLRPGNPPQLEKARELFHEKFFDTNRYRLGRVGRFRINRKFDQDDPRGPDDPATRGLRQRDPVHPQPAARARGTSTTSTTWATAGCGPSTSWPPTSCARASSSSAAPSRSG